MKNLELANVNNVSIIGLSDGGEMLVPIKPICEALGIATQSQIEKIKVDEKLSSVATLSIATGADGKQYKMFSIPFKYVFGWLFTINPKNVNPEAKDALLKYQMQCYDILYDHFMGPQEFLSKRDEVIDRETEEYERYKLEHAEAKQKMNTAKSNLDKAKSMTLHEWRQNKSQLQVFSDDEQKGETTEE